MYSIFGLIVWLFLLAAAYPYVQRIRHREAKPLASYIVFVIVFCVTSSFLFWVGSAFVAHGFGREALNWPPVAAAIFTLTFAPGVFIARWAIKRPPRESTVPN